MAKTKPKHRPGIHLLKGKQTVNIEGELTPCIFFYWHTRAKNGRITSNGETYKTKQGALDGASSAAKTFGASGRFKYYDHTKPDSPLQSYL
jgi:uncharacterized protein YegP (UPF0339 family)